MRSQRQFKGLLLGTLIMLLSGCIDMPIQMADLGGTAQPTQQEMSDAIRQALSQGITRSIEQLGRSGGFSEDPRVRVPLPDELDRVATTLEKFGQERYVQEFEQSLNRAAEESVPYAAAIFSRALRAMTVEDAIGIVRGPDDAATRYFRERMLPVAASHLAMLKSGAEPVIV